MCFLILRTENILYDRKLKKNPKIFIKKYLNQFIYRIDTLKEYLKFHNNNYIAEKKFILENTHKNLFQNLWTYFNEKEYKKERIGRYIKRIKINNLVKLIKNKTCVDFGCGHGNFLAALITLGAKRGYGIDFGNDSIKYAKKISKLLKIHKKLNFYNRTVYKSGFKNNFFDFAIQNGVFHHIKNEDKAYREVYRVLKKNAYFWIYTDGGGGLRDFINDMCQEILKSIDKNFVVNTIRETGFSKNKVYHLSDHINAKYRHTTKEKLISKLKKIGFRNFKQLSGGMNTDSDKPFVSDKYFKIKFGSGDLRILCQK